uniref:Uncharacterized protein n=1 Tax=Rhizophora mucronata TaxID=61149 RepID=A0A2P2NJC0_RHIMU
MNPHIKKQTPLKSSKVFSNQLLTTNFRALFWSN